jgi:outer membrane immunogenic protein
MRQLLASSVAALSALLLAGSAIAADLQVKPKRERAQQPQQQASNWNGGQAGGSNGASSVNNNFVEPGSYNFSECVGSCFETPFSFSGNKTSYIIGLFLGYRWQMANIVVGVEGDVNWKRGETSAAQYTPLPYLCCNGDEFTGSLKQGWDSSFRGRFGVLVTPWTLLYATGGLAIGQVSGSFSYYAESLSGATIVSGSSSWTDTRVGGTVGAGVETQIVPGVTARFEYRYTDFGKFSKDVPLSTVGPCAPGSCGTNAHIDLRAFNHRATVGIGFSL